MLDFVTWNADPILFSLGPISVRWYGLAFAIGFIIGYNIVAKCLNMKEPRKNGLASCLPT